MVSKGALCKDCVMPPHAPPLIQLKDIEGIFTKKD